MATCKESLAIITASPSGKWAAAFAITALQERQMGCQVCNNRFAITAAKATDSAVEKPPFVSIQPAAMDQDFRLPPGSGRRETAAGHN
jgi:hypothetical protein